MELVGDETEDVFPVGLGGIAAVAVVPAELFQVVIQSRIGASFCAVAERGERQCVHAGDLFEHRRQVLGDRSSTGAPSIAGLPL